MLSTKKLVKRSLHFVLSVNLVFYSLAPAFSTPVFASTETAENKQTTVISKEVSNIVPVDRPIDIEPVPEPVIRPIDIGQIKPLEIMPGTGSTKEKPGEEVLLDAPGAVPLDMYDNRDNAGKKPSDPVGQYNVDEFTGLFSYSYPLQIPAGRNNLQPTVNLQYNHRQQNLGSFVGFGWELNMPSISRDNRSGVDKLYTDNYFRLNLSGSDILEPISVDANGYGVYGKKIESDFLKIEFASSSNSWIVTDKLGVIYTFGSTTASRQDNPGDNTQIYQWMLEEIRDTNDNFIRYEYYKDAGQIYPNKIFYTGHGITDGIFEVAFEPFANGTPIENNLKTISYQTGFAVETKYLLDRVDVKINDILSNSYDLNLDINANSNKYLLESITPKFYQDAVGLVKDKVEFDYSQEETSYRIADDGLFDLPNNYILGGVDPIFDTKRNMFVDLDADGLADYVRMYCANGSLSVNVWENDALGGWATSTYSQFIGSGFSCSRLYGAAHSIPVSFANLNGDALIDMVTDNLFYINTGSAWQTEAGSLPISLVQGSGNNQPPMNTVMFQDMNNDGYDDIVYEFHPNNNTSNIEVYIKNPSTNTWILNNSYNLSVDLEISDCLIYGGDPYAFVDYNNDGLLDVFYNFNCSFFQYNPPMGEAAYLNNGDGFVVTTDYNPLEVVSYFSTTSSSEQHVNYFTDLDADSVDDFAVFNRSIANNISSGNFTFTISSNSPSNLFNIQSGGISYLQQQIPVALADFDGDQKQDVMHSFGDGNIVYLAEGAKPDILKKIDQQSGASLYINYDFSTREKDQNNNLLNPDLPFNLYVVKEVVVDNGTQQYQGYQYEYSDGQTISYPTEKIKDTYGFAKVAKKVGQARPDVDLGDGSDGAFVSSSNETWTTNKNFTSLHIQTGHTITVEPNVVIKVAGDVVIDGILSADSMGGDGGSHDPNGGQSGFGPGGGGGGFGGAFTGGSGGGGGHATTGQNCYGQFFCNAGYGVGGQAYGYPNLDTSFIGSGGGGGQDNYPAPAGDGGDGGGIIQIFANNLIVNGQIDADGENGESGGGGQNYGYHYGGSGGGGSGGSIHIKVFTTANIGDNLVHSKGGQGGFGDRNNGGHGADGRIRIEAKNITGQTEPAYFSQGKFTYSIDNVVDDESLQKQINYYHTAKDDNLSLHGKIKKSEKYDTDDNLINKSFITWQEEDLDGDRKFVYSDEKSGINFSSSTLATATQSDYDLTNGNLVTENNLGQVELNTNTGEILDILAGDEKTTTYEYAQNTTKHILSAPKEKVITDTADTKSQELYYDDLAFGQVNKVNLTKEDYLVDNVEINREFNDLGLVVAETDPENNVSEIVYDEYDLYPSETVNSLNQITYTDYNLLNSQVATSTAANGAMTVNSFDAFGRLIKTQISSPSSTTELLTKQEIIYQDSNIGGASFNRELSLDDDTLALWHLDGELGSTEKLNDASQDYDLVEVNNPANYTGFNGENNGAYTFDGTVDYLQTASSFTSFGQDDFTVESWVKPASAGIVTRGWFDAGNVSGWLMNITSEGCARFAISQGSDGTVISVVSDVDLLDDNWHYLVASRQGNDLNLYVDGDLVDTNTGVDNYNLSQVVPVFIGWRSSFPDYSGAIDEIRISDRARSAQEISLYYNAREQFSPSHRYTETRNYFDIASYKISREYYNGLDQVVQKKSQTASSTQWSTQDIAYDALGRVVRQSLPYISQNIDYSEPDLQQVAKTYTYDALDRVLTETTPVGTTTYSYDGLTTSIYDANNNRKDLIKDAHGNLVQVKEYNAQDIYITNYEYTLTNKLSKITDALGNVRNFVYDDLDNLVSQDMIHRPNAQSIPSMNYTYDKNGNVLTQTNFNNQIISYTYDDLNRVLTESVNGSIKTTYTYDQGANNVGKLTYINYNHNGNWQSYNYNLLNQLTDYDVRIHGDNYAVNYSYNLDNNLKQIDYPNNKQANYSFNNIGQVSSLSVASSTIASNLQYNVNGQLTHLERANGLTTDYSYTPSQAYRLTNLSTTNASSTLQNISYTYDAVGNILNIMDNANTDLAKSATYAYDDLNRLASTTVSYVNIPNSNYSQNFSYDAIGNILTNSALGAYSYTLANPQQLSSVPNQNFTYDNAGNLLSDSQKTLTWDWRSRMIKSQNTGSQNISNYTYDANNQRLMKQTQEPVEIILPLKSGSSGINGLSGANPPPPVQYTTIAEEHYIDQYYERNDINNDTKDHIFLNGQKVATINNNNAPYYIISDHLNSSSILVDNAGNIAEVSDYMPFGTEVYSHTITDLKNDYNFTGKETDEESTLQYFGARYMDNNIGRFVSVDPVALVLHDGNKLKEITKGGLQQLLANPQNLNGYSYAVNNPVIMRDDDGNFAFLIPLAYYAAVYGTPMLITAIASAGAYISAKEFGQAVGYTMEGRDDLAQQHFDNSIMADVAVASGAGGLLYAESMAVQQNPNKGYVVPGQKITSSNQVPSGIKNQIPENWGSGRQTDNGKGWIWTDPNNANNEIRFMSGSPANQYQNSQTPYVRVTQDIGGQRRYLDAYGNVGVNKSSETHFNPNSFNIGNYNF